MEEFLTRRHKQNLLFVKFSWYQLTFIVYYKSLSTTVCVVVQGEQILLSGLDKSLPLIVFKS